MPARIPRHRETGPGCAPLPDRRRRNAFYASAPWRRLRRAFLAENLLCTTCERKGLTVAAAHVHHRQPWATHPALALQWSNLQSLCQPCHNSQSIR